MIINKDLIFTLFSRFAVIFFGIATSIVTAQSLGTSGRGEYFYIITLATLATQFGNPGLVTSNTYELSKNKSLFPQLAANSFWISLVFGSFAACSVLIFSGNQNNSPWLDEQAWMLTIMVPTMLYGLLASNLFIGMSLFRHYNYFQLGSAALQLLGVAAAAWMVWGVNTFLLVSALTSLIGAGALMIMLARFNRLTWRFDFVLFRSNLGYSGRVYVATLLSYGVSRAGVLMLARFADKDEIGIYSVALQFSDVLMIVPATVAMVLFPDLLKGQLEHRFAKTMHTTAKIAVLMALLCLLTGFVAAWVVPIFFGEAFVPAVRVLWWMLPGVFFLSLASIVSQYLATKGIPLSNVWAWLGALVFLLATCSYLITRWGALGAAVSQTMTYILLAITLIILATRHNRSR